MPKTSTHYVSVFMRQARLLKLDTDKILAQAGIPPALCDVEDQWIDNTFAAALMKTMWRESRNETFGFDPEPMPPGTWSLACEFMLTAETLGDLYRKGEHILSYLPPSSTQISMALEGESVIVRPGIYTGDQDPDRFLAEFITLLWHRFTSWAIDESIQLREVFFSYPKPPHGDLYDEFFHCDVAFEQQDIGFCFSKKYLNKRIVRNKAELDEWLRDAPADVLYMPGRETSVQSHIKLLLVDELKSCRRFPAFEAVCSRLAMSPQVIRRRLSEEGTSYQQIKDSVRRDLALELLSNSEILITEIAERTGFAESAAFSRAFKKWVGMSPAQFRASELSGG